MKGLFRECPGKILKNKVNFLVFLYTGLILFELSLSFLENGRCRHGYFHVVNNDYTHWGMYAIGGSAAPTINSQGNRFLAPNNKVFKEVTKS